MHVTPASSVAATPAVGRPRFLIPPLVAAIVLASACTPAPPVATATPSPAASPASPVASPASPVASPASSAASPASLVASPTLSIPVYTDPAQPIEVQVGDEFGLAFPTNPGIQYQWHLVEEPDGAVLDGLGHRDSIPPNPGKAAGGPSGTRTWTFRAVGPGEVRLRWVYATRPGEESRTSNEPREFAVRVRPHLP